MMAMLLFTSHNRGKTNGSSKHTAAVHCAIAKFIASVGDYSSLWRAGTTTLYAGVNFIPPVRDYEFGYSTGAETAGILGGGRSCEYTVYSMHI